MSIAMGGYGSGAASASASGAAGASSGGAGVNPYLIAGMAGLKVYNKALEAKNLQKQKEYQAGLQHKSGMMDALESLIGISRGI